MVALSGGTCDLPEDVVAWFCGIDTDTHTLSRADEPPLQDRHLAPAGCNHTTEFVWVMKTTQIIIFHTFTRIKSFIIIWVVTMCNINTWEHLFKMLAWMYCEYAIFVCNFLGGVKIGGRFFLHPTPLFTQQ